MIWFEEGGWWLPDGEEHLQAWMLQVGARHARRLTYQRHKYLKALSFVPAERRVAAIDVGAHVGLWSWQMVWDFATVLAFEPMPAHRACWIANMEGIDDAVLSSYALGEIAGVATLATRTPNSSGDTGIMPDGSGVQVHLTRLDDLHPAGVDLLKIDCEGYELFVCRGARETLLRCRPVVIVEQKPETGMEGRYGIGTTDAVAFLESLGMVRKAVVQGDYIMAWA